MRQVDQPDFIKGYFGVINKKADRSRMSVGERLQEDKILFMEILPEFFCLMKTYGLKWPVGDEITEGFIEFTKAKRPKLWHCFAAQILLDIYHKLRLNPAGPWNDLRMAGLRISKTITDFNVLSATHPKPAFWPGPKEGDQEIDNIEKCIDACIKRDPQLALWHYQMSMQTHDEVFFYKKNPILCGLLMFQLTSRMQIIGQGLVNQWYDVQQMAFLYNLVQKVPNETLEWPDIEAFISIHGEKRIFIGDRPKNAAESLNRLEAVTGISSVTRFARDARRTRSWHLPDGKRSRLLELTTRSQTCFRAVTAGPN